MNENYELHSRRGRFILTLHDLHGRPDDVMLIMGKMVIFRCEMMYFDQFHYSAISPLFDRLEDGEELPWYEVKAENGEIMVRRKDD